MSPKTPPAGGAAVDELLAPGFLENATQSSMAEVRRLRAQAGQEGDNLSYNPRQPPAHIAEPPLQPPPRVGKVALFLLGLAPRPPYLGHGALRRVLEEARG